MQKSTSCLSRLSLKKSTSCLSHKSSKKKGISTVVATVLIVLITVASVTILWAGLYPILAKTFFVEDLNVKFTVDKAESYTVYDNANGLLNIRVKRGADTANVVALKFVIDATGDSIIRRVYNEDVVKPNQARVYQFAIGFYDDLNSVKLVPIYLVRGEEVEGSMFSIEERIPVIPNKLVTQIGSGDVTGIEVPEGLVLYYSFDEAPIGGKLFDFSGYNHTGVITNAQYTTNGKVGGAFVFDGDGDYVSLMTLPSGESLATANKTITFWAKPECKTGDSIIFGSEDNYYLDFYNICGTGDNLKFLYTNSIDYPRYLNLGAIEERNWHYYTIIIRVAGSNVYGSLYLDGQLSSTPSRTDGYGITIDRNFYLGTNALNPSSNSFNGTIDEFRVYNRVLNETEITQLYEITKE